MWLASTFVMSADLHDKFAARLRWLQNPLHLLYWRTYMKDTFRLYGSVMFTYKYAFI